LPGPDQHVHRLKARGAERHCGDRLNAAQMHRGDRLGVRAALVRWGAGGDVADPGNPRGDDRHVRRGNHRISPTRHITADTANRDVLMAEHDTGQGLDLDIFE